MATDWFNEGRWARLREQPTKRPRYDAPSKDTQAYFEGYYLEDERISGKELPRAVKWIDESASTADMIVRRVSKDEFMEHVEKSDGNSGTDLIFNERQRQISKEGWTPQHDDEHTDGSLIEAARAYTWAAFCEVALKSKAKDFKYVPNDWPPDWDDDWWKPSDDPIRNLAKSGALLAAEIDRLQRARRKAE